MPRIVIGIPAKDEADRIGACLAALAGQDCDDFPTVVLMVNNTTDPTAEVARACAARCNLHLETHEVWLPPDRAHAGTARSLAMARAAEIAGPHGVLLTTDADSRVPPGWLAANMAALACGADAVAGRAVIDPDEAKLIPVRLHEADGRECAYAAMIDEIASLLDPDPFDPWPRHDEASGASLAVTAAAFAAVGGVPEVALGEDRAFVRRLVDHGFHVRHDPAVWVTVSGRTEGRAKGGMAETIRRRMSAPDLLVDDRLEPAEAAARRARLRWFARAVMKGAVPVATLAAALRRSPADIAAALVGPFGPAWTRLEASTPALRRYRMPVAELAAQTRIARRIRDALVRRGRDGPVDIGAAARA